MFPKLVVYGHYPLTDRFPLVMLQTFNELISASNVIYKGWCVILKRVGLFRVSYSKPQIETFLIMRRSCDVE